MCACVKLDSLEMKLIATVWHYDSLGSRPSPYVRVLIARGWANLSSGNDSSREA